jgi:hypothetical protein
VDDIPLREQQFGKICAVLSRHAGPGDSVLLVHELVTLGYRPRLVLKGSLQWAPLLDVILNRVPSSFVGPRGRTGVEEVGRRLRSRLLIASGYLVSDVPSIPGFRIVERLSEDGWAADLLARHK